MTGIGTTGFAFGWLIILGLVFLGVLFILKFHNKPHSTKKTKKSSKSTKTVKKQKKSSKTNNKSLKRRFPTKIVMIFLIIFGLIFGGLYLNALSQIRVVESTIIDVEN